MKNQPDADYIRRMFDSFASRYDIFTFLIGFGQAARLREEVLKGVSGNMRVLDLACGTGDLAIAAAGKVGPGGESVGLDFSEKMLAIADKKHKRLDLPPENFRLVLRDAKDLPLDERPFDLIVSGFAFRNLYENIEKILDGMRRSLKTGGRIAVLDLTEPENPLLAKIFKSYLYFCVGLYGTLLFGKNYPVAYLPDSASRFFRARQFKQALEKTGFKSVRARSFFFGAVTLYEAAKD